MADSEATHPSVRDAWCVGVWELQTLHDPTSVRMQAEKLQPGFIVFYFGPWLSRPWGRVDSLNWEIIPTNIDWSTPHSGMSFHLWTPKNRSGGALPNV